MNLKARLYDLGMRLAGSRMDRRRQALVAEAEGRVLELGVGTGQNLRFYKPGTQVTGLEPDHAMLGAAIPRATGAMPSGWLVRGAGEALPFRTGSFDQVVASLVLCSVTSPAQTLSEVRRVLKPGGQLRFYEHVRSDVTGWARIQDLVTPAWRWFADGCTPNRDTVAAIEEARFTVQAIERFGLGPYPTRPQVLGVASRQD